MYSVHSPTTLFTLTNFNKIYSEIDITNSESIDHTICNRGTLDTRGRVKKITLH